jgi:DNA processing protein
MGTMPKEQVMFRPTKESGLESESLHCLALKLTPGLDSRDIARVVERCGSAEAVFRAGDPSSLDELRLPEEATRAIRDGSSLKKAEEEWRRLAKLSGRVLTVFDAGYPRLLKAIHDPPPVLFVRGNLGSGDRPALAVVGSRTATAAGVTVAKRFAGELARLGFTVVSGLARGIDAAAHEAALDARGNTVAVLGTGLDVPYPKTNARLRKRMEKDGVLVTEFPMGTPPYPANFPVRNRIISGLCLGTMVVEAAARSGSLITARLALEQGREVFAVPGGILSDTMAGCNALIQQGAKLVMETSDILEEMPPEIQAGFRIDERGSREDEDDAALTDDEKRVIKLIRSEAPVHIDRIAESLKFQVGELMQVLFSLEMKDMIQQLPGKMFLSK